MGLHAYQLPISNRHLFHRFKEVMIMISNMGLCLSSFSFSFLLGFSPLFWLFFLWSFLLASFSPLCSSIANMAHSSSRRRTVPERSRSRDNYMWQNRHTQRNDWQHYPWPEDPPPAPRVRKVLVIVDLEQVRPLMNKTHDDSMAVTTCEVLPRLSRVEERALFTYNVLLNTHRLETFTVYNLLYCISQHIWYTWDRFLPPSSMDIRWQDDTGDTFALRNDDCLVAYLNAYRPHWTEGQEHSEILPDDIQLFMDER